MTSASKAACISSSAPSLATAQRLLQVESALTGEVWHDGSGDGGCRRRDRRTGGPHFLPALLRVCRHPHIRVNAVSPGVTQTPMPTPESYDALGDRPLGRVSDVVDGILFPESSSTSPARSSTLMAARSQVTDGTCTGLVTQGFCRL